MELIDRYVYAVTNRLPEKQREEISKELRGLIEDMLEEQAPHGEPGPEDVEQVLLKLGPPAQMAAKYRGYERYLIGPALFDSYLSTIKVVSISILIAMSAVFVIEAILEPVSILDHFVGYLVSLFTTGTQGFFWVTAVFAMIEYGIQKKPDGKESWTGQKWTPGNLPPVPDVRSQIKLGEPVAGIIFTILFTVIFMFGNDLIGAYRIHDGVLTSIPVMNADVIRRFLPFIGALGALAVLREIWKIVVRRRTLPLLVYHVCLSLLSLIFAVILVGAPGFWNAGFLSQLQASGFLSSDGEAYDTVKSIWTLVTENFVILITLTTFIDIISEWYKWFRAKMA